MSFISFGPTTDCRGTLLSSRESLSQISLLRLFRSLIFFFITSKTFSSNLILQVWNTIFITGVFQSTSLSYITYEVVCDNAVESTFVLRLYGSLIFVFIARLLVPTSFFKYEIQCLALESNQLRCLAFTYEVVYDAMLWNQPSF